MARTAQVAIKDFELIYWLAELTLSQQATKRLINGVDQKMARGALRRLAKAIKTMNSWGGK